MNSYGKELILDLHDCDSALFTRKNIRKYFKRICDLINMERGKLCWWDDLYTPEEEKETEAHLVGTSAVQFIRTSSIVIHSLDLLGVVYLNIFSCKDFDSKLVIEFSAKWFAGKVLNSHVICRKKPR